MTGRPPPCRCAALPDTPHAEHCPEHPTWVARMRDYAQSTPARLLPPWATFERDGEEVVVWQRNNHSLTVLQSQRNRNELLFDWDHEYGEHFSEEDVRQLRDALSHWLEDGFLKRGGVR